MRTIDKIREYIKRHRESGELKAGSCLPSSNEMMKLFGASYATVRSALKTLAEEGLVDVVNGKGSFVAGAKKLDVVFYCLPSTLNQLKEILDKYIPKSNLYLNIRLKNVYLLINGEENGIPDSSSKAVIIECAPEMTYNIPGLYNFTEYDGYNALLQKLMPDAVKNMNGGLPFYSYTYQLAVNYGLLKKIGFPEERITGDFQWWEDFLKVCRKADVCPAMFIWKREAKWPFNTLYCPFFSLKLHETDSTKALLTPRRPYFEGDAGRRLLKILRDCDFSPDASGKFFNQDKTVMNFSQGSWITVQNKKRDYCNINDLKIIPYKFGRKRIINMQTNNLHTYISPTANTEEKLRIWKLLQQLLSKNFQKDFCGITGAISVRNDLAARDYSWYCKEYASFMPGPDDIIISNQIFSRSMRAYLTALAELYLFNDADSEGVLKFMDSRIQP